MSDEAERGSLIEGRIDIKILLAFAFGVIFIGVLLIFTTLVRNPSEIAVWVYKVVLALAAAGFAAVLPGFLDIKFKSIIQAGGALGVFALVLYLAPTPSRSAPPPLPPPPVPAVSAEPTALSYMDLVDRNHIADAFAATDPAQNYEWAEFKQAFAAGRTPLGSPVNRVLMGGSPVMINPPGSPPGAYKGFTYRSKYSADSLCRQEAIVLRGVDKTTWKVASYTIAMTPVPC